MRSANHGCWVLQNCGSSSRCTASSWLSTGAIAAIVSLVRDDQLAGRRCGAGGELVRRLQQLVVGHAAVHEATPLGGSAVEHFAEQDRRHRGLGTGDASQHPRVPAPGMEAELQETGVELGSAAAMRTSQPSAMFIPAPTAAPLTAAIVGSGLRATRRNPS